jgi:hypothetical protein
MRQNTIPMYLSLPCHEWPISITPITLWLAAPLETLYQVHVVMAFLHSALPQLTMFHLKQQWWKSSTFLTGISKSVVLRFFHQTKQMLSARQYLLGLVKDWSITDLMAMVFYTHFDQDPCQDHKSVVLESGFVWLNIPEPLTPRYTWVWP